MRQSAWLKRLDRDAMRPETVQSSSRSDACTVIEPSRRYKTRLTSSSPRAAKWFSVRVSFFLHHTFGWCNPEECEKLVGEPEFRCGLFRGSLNSTRIHFSSERERLSRRAILFLTTCERRLSISPLPRFLAAWKRSTPAQIRIRATEAGRVALRFRLLPRSPTCPNCEPA